MKTIPWFKTNIRLFSLVFLNGDTIAKLKKIFFFYHGCFLPLLQSLSKFKEFIFSHLLKIISLLIVVACWRFCLAFSLGFLQFLHFVRCRFFFLDMKWPELFTWTNIKGFRKNEIKPHWSFQCTKYICI